MIIRAADLKLHQFIRESRTRVESLDAEGEEATLKRLVLEELGRLDAEMQAQTQETRREQVEAAQASDALDAAEDAANTAYRRIYHLLSMHVLRQQLESDGAAPAQRRAVELFLEGTPPSGFMAYASGAKVQALERCLSFGSALGGDDLSVRIVADARAALDAFTQAHAQWLTESQEAKLSRDVLDQTVAGVRVRYRAARLILQAWLMRAHQEERLSAIMPPLRALTRSRRRTGAASDPDPQTPPSSGDDADTEPSDAP